MGEVALLYDDQGVLQVEMYELNAQTCPHCRPALTFLNRTLPHPHYAREGHTIHLWIPRGGGYGGLRAGSFNEFSYLCRSVFDGSPQANLPPVFLHSLYTEPDVSGGPRMLCLPLPYCVRMPPPTDSLLCVRVKKAS